MKNAPLFRQAALNARHIKWLGDIVVARPLSFAILTMSAVGMALLIVGFLVFGTYTRRATVSGQLAPDVGVLRIYAPQAGVVGEKHVREGGTERSVSRQGVIPQNSLIDEQTYDSTL